ncbi:MAG: glycosyltransferase family 39 protein [Acidimicrobiales bacterium]
MAEDLAEFAWRPVAAIAAALAAVLIGFSGRYGYDRDELYFIECGKHLAWGYPDQPPLVPLIARIMTAISPTSLVVLRLPSALSAASLIVITALLARELGAGRAAQVLAAGAMAVASITIATGHLLSTSTFELPFWAIVSLLIIRILRRGDQRLWVLVGLVTGIGLFDSDLIAFLLFAVVVGLCVAGPRHCFKTPWLYMGGVIAAVLWTPYLVWQARHGWPQLTVSRSIAAGGSATSTPRWLVIPEQLVLVSIYFAPVWVAGLVRLFRARTIPWTGSRALAVAYGVLVVVFIATGGKAYYLGGMFPLLLGAGAQPVIDWIRSAPADQLRPRRRLVVAAFLLSLIELPVVLPIVPATALHDTPIVSLNSDAGETVAWPTFVTEIAKVYSSVPQKVRGSTIILTGNYGEAGAVDRFGARYGLPTAYSGHNAFWYWGPPPPSVTAAVAVGFPRSSLTSVCGSLKLATRLNNHLDISDEEQGAPVWMCTDLLGSWKVLWPKLRDFG